MSQVRSVTAPFRNLNYPSQQNRSSPQDPSCLWCGSPSEKGHFYSMTATVHNDNEEFFSGLNQERIVLFPMDDHKMVKIGSCQSHRPLLYDLYSRCNKERLLIISNE